MSMRKRKILLGSLGGVGLLFAVLAGVAEHVPWLHSICSGLGDGCQETATYALFNIPLWIYGVLYYVVFMAAVFVERWQPLVDWLVGALLGVEATLVVMMASERMICVYCLGNLVAVLAIFLVVFHKEIFWRTVSLSLLAFLLSFHFIVKLDAAGGAVQAGPDPPQVAAKVGEQEISMAQVEAPLVTQLFDLRREMHRLKREKLDDMIVEALLQQEAAARNMTVQQLVDAEVVSKGITVSDGEVDQYYLENRARLAEWKGSLDELRNRIRSALQQQKTYQKVMEYARSLESKYPVSDYLEEPVSPYAVLKTEGSPSLGPEDAAVTVFEFSDYECPACRQAHEVVRKVRAHYGQSIRWIFKDYPLRMHEYAREAAAGARCAGDQGKFWEFQDLLYGSKEALTRDTMRKLAADLGLNAELFGSCLDSGKYKEAVEKDLEEAKQAGLDRTPSFLINGRLITGGHGFERFVQMIDEELKKPRRRP
jgi:protein-disulfide isomerase